jgi:hypothetical protein
MKRIPGRTSTGSRPTGGSLTSPGTQWNLSVTGVVTGSSSRTFQAVVVEGHRSPGAEKVAGADGQLVDEEVPREPLAERHAGRRLEAGVYFPRAPPDDRIPDIEELERLPDPRRGRRPRRSRRPAARVAPTSRPPGPERGKRQARERQREARPGEVDRERRPVVVDPMAGGVDRQARRRTSRSSHVQMAVAGAARLAERRGRRQRQTPSRAARSRKSAATTSQSASGARSVVCPGPCSAGRGTNAVRRPAARAAARS